MGDWRNIKIANLADENLGKISFIDGDWIESEFITNSGIRIIQTGNIGIGRYLDKSNNKKFISKVSFDFLRCKKVFPGDIIICRLADPIGRACIVPKGQEYYVTAVDVIIFRPSEEYAKEFLLYALNSEITLRDAKDQSGGSTRQRISRRNYGSLSIRIPKRKKEQSIIATILSTVDTAIEKTEQLIAKYELIKTGLMQDLLTCGIDEEGNIRSEETHEFKDSPLGRIPLDWEAITIGNIANLVTNGFVGVATPFYTSSSLGVPYLFGKNVRSNRIDLKGVRFIKKSFNASQKKSQLNPGDMVTVQSGHIGTTAVIPKDLQISNCHALIITKFKKGYVIPKFVSMFCNYYLDIGKMSHLFVGSTIKHINTSDFKNFSIVLPTLKEQKLIVRKVFELNNVISNYTSELDKLQKQKTALMQDLLTGKVRVDNLLEATT